MSKQVKNLTEATTLADTDLLYVVIDPSGVSEAGKKITKANLKATLGIRDTAFVTVGANNADYVTDGVADQVQIQQAIDAVNALGGGLVYLKDNNYSFASNIVPKSNVTLKGNGATVIEGSLPYGQFVVGLTAVSYFNVEDITFDLLDTDRMGGFYILDYSNCRFSRLRFQGATTTQFSSWYFLMGSSDGTSATITCFDNLFEDITFDGHKSTLEMFILYNTKNTRIRNFTFKNKIGIGASPVAALFQNCEDTTIDNTIFENCAGGWGWYITTSCHNTVFNGFKGTNSGLLIRIGDDSDNGTFGSSVCKKVIINDLVAIGETLSTQTCLKLGAADNVIINNPIISNYLIAILISNGVPTTNAPLTNFIINNMTLFNNNPTDDYHAIHGAIQFQTIGGSLKGKFIGGSIYDDQVTQTQRYPITFIDPFTWSDIEFIDTTFIAETGYLPIQKNGGAITDNSVVFRNCIGVNPDKAHNQGNVTGSTTFDRVNGNVIMATLTGNTTGILTAAVNKGDKLTLVLTQDATGNRTITWPTNFKKAGGTLVLSDTGNTTDTILMEYDGTDWREVSRAMNLG